MSNEQYVIGLDYGSDSVRALLVNANTGDEIATSVFYYPRWRDGLFCDPALNRFRQHPLDYMEGLEATIKDCLSQAGPSVASAVAGISVDTTGSTPIAVDEKGVPLSLKPGFENNPDAMFVLWKDHTAIQEAAELNEYAKKFKTNYLQFVGGIYSSEWFWAKLLHILRESEAVRGAIYSWVEHCDWIPFLLTGGNDVHQMKRSVCAAGHKSLWAMEFGGLPPEEFFASWDPLLKGFTDRLFKDAYTADQRVGFLSPEWAEKLGLSTQVAVGVGAFDCHMGAVGGQIEPYHLSKVMGTSTCDMMVAPLSEMKGKLVHGICGQVPGSIIPGMMGMEAGQSGFGDDYAWFRNLLAWPLKELLNQSDLIDSEKADAIYEQLRGRIIPALEKAADALPFSSAISEFGVDWLNGRRTPDASQLLKGGFFGLTLGSDAPKVYRALAESTCFGAKRIVNRFNREGVVVRGLIGLGGVSKKSPFIMQMMADIMDMPIRIHASDQTCAFGAAMFAATVSGVYPRVEEAMQSMGRGFTAEYKPNKERVAIYEQRYRHYRDFGDFIEKQCNPNIKPLSI